MSDGILSGPRVEARPAGVMRAVIDVNDALDNEIVPAQALKQIIVLNYAFVVEDDVRTTWKSATTAISGAMRFLPGAGIAVTDSSARIGLIETEINEALNLHLDAPVQVSGHLSYILL